MADESSFVPGRRFRPLELVIQRGFPLESESQKKIYVLSADKSMQLATCIKKYCIYYVALSLCNRIQITSLPMYNIEYYSTNSLSV